MSGFISLDYSFLLSENLCAENGVSLKELENTCPELEKIRKELLEKRTQKGFAWLSIPENAKKIINEIEMIRYTLPASVNTLVVVGIGGSSLGTRALIEALHPSDCLKKIRVIFMENVDPESVSEIFDTIDHQKTVFNIVSKSGRTLETVSQFFLIREFLEKKSDRKDYKRRIIITTDPDEGFLREVAGNENIRNLTVPREIGGRFSVLTPVGLFPCACAGIHVEKILSGAAYALDHFKNTDVSKNMPLISAALRVLMSENQGKNIRVFMTYSDSLKSFGAWFAQLWNESLGKKRDSDGKMVGSALLTASGTVDQHSLLQMLIEGKQDKIIDFVRVKKFRKDLTIPPAYSSDPEGMTAGSKQVSEIFNTELTATMSSLVSSKRPCSMYSISEISPFVMGMLLFTFEIETAAAGLLLGINPFDQPGVELGKNIAYGILRRPGYEKYLEMYQSVMKEKKKFEISY
jgi:glucose-6-phosphate isomerase